MRGQLQTTVMAIVVAVVVLFIGLYMVAKVADVASINNTSDFYTTFTSLVTNTGTIYDVLILVVIIVGLAVAIGVISGFGRAGGGGTAI